MKDIEDEDGKVIDQEFNTDSIAELKCMAEPSITDAKPGERFQFFRHGYYVADEKLSTEDHKVFNSIVDLKSSFKIKK